MIEIVEVKASLFVLNLYCFYHLFEEQFLIFLYSLIKCFCQRILGWMVNARVGLRRVKTPLFILGKSVNDTHAFISFSIMIIVFESYCLLLWLYVYIFINHLWQNNILYTITISIFFNVRVKFTLSFDYLMIIIVCCCYWKQCKVNTGSLCIIL